MRSTDWSNKKVAEDDRWTADEVEEYWSKNKVDEKNPRPSSSMKADANDAEEKKAKKAPEAADVRRRTAAGPHRKAMEYKAVGRLAKSGDRTMGLHRALLVVEHLSYASLMSLALLPRKELPARLQRRRKVDDADDDAGGDGADDDGSESVDGGVTTEEYDDEGNAKRAKPRQSKAKNKLK